MSILSTSVSARSSVDSLALLEESLRMAEEFVAAGSPSGRSSNYSDAQLDEYFQHFSLEDNDAVSSTVGESEGSLVVASALDLWSYKGGSSEDDNVCHNLILVVWFSHLFMILMFF